MATAAPVTSWPRGRITNMNRGSRAMFSTPPMDRPKLAWEEWPVFRSRWARVRERMVGVEPRMMTKRTYWDAKPTVASEAPRKRRMGSRSRAIRREKTFLPMYRLPERSRLLTTLRPSSTTAGIFPKSDSSSTSCEACTAASLPEAMATEQSDSFIARISLTPSPVMATVCPASFSALTKSFFCSGETRPKTVYLRIADFAASSVVSVDASMQCSAVAVRLWKTKASLSLAACA